MLTLDEDSELPLFQQLYEAIRREILTGKRAPGSPLPSSRELAKQLRVSRMTIVTAFDQLRAEGYLDADRGRGTYVRRELPDDVERASSARTRSTGDSAKRRGSRTKPTRAPKLSNTGQRIQADASLLPARTAEVRAFQPGIPALDQFPIATWSKLVRARWRELATHSLTYGSPAGYWPLRQALIKYLSSYRGVRGDATQVMIVNGTQQAIDLTARLLLNSGDRVLFENPGYKTGRAALVAAGANLLPLPIDAKGAQIDGHDSDFQAAKLAYVTPSHQFPMGVTMSLERRMALLQWAERSNAYVLEDDYDSEYRYGQRPIPSLQGLDECDRTIYVGSFAKVAFPAMGLGYIVVPPALVDPMETALAMASRPPSLVDQMTVCDFIEHGYFHRHLRRMRNTHQIRRDCLTEQIDKHLSSHLEVVGAEAGLHLTAKLRRGLTDRTVALEAAKAGLMLRTLSEYCLPGTKRRANSNGLIFGFACLAPTEIRVAVRKLSEVLQSLAPSQRRPIRKRGK